MDTVCAGCRLLEITVQCEEHTHTSAFEKDQGSQNSNWYAPGTNYLVFLLCVLKKNTTSTWRVAMQVCLVQGILLRWRSRCCCCCCCRCCCCCCCRCRRCRLDGLMSFGGGNDDVDARLTHAISRSTRPFAVARGVPACLVVLRVSLSCLVVSPALRTCWLHACL